jgi:hypothetical protein
LAHVKEEVSPLDRSHLRSGASHGRNGVVLCIVHGQHNIAALQNLRLEMLGCHLSALAQSVRSRDCCAWSLELPRCHGFFGPHHFTSFPRLTRNRTRAICDSTTTSLHPRDSFPILAVEFAYLTLCCCYTRTFYSIAHDLQAGSLSVQTIARTSRRQRGSRQDGRRRPHLPSFGGAIPQIRRYDRYAIFRGPEATLHPTASPPCPRAASSIHTCKR